MTNLLTTSKLPGWYFDNLISVINNHDNDPRSLAKLTIRFLDAWESIFLLNQATNNDVAHTFSAQSFIIAKYFQQLLLCSDNSIEQRLGILIFNIAFRLTQSCEFYDEVIYRLLHSYQAGFPDYFLTDSHNQLASELLTIVVDFDINNYSQTDHQYSVNLLEKLASYYSSSDKLQKEHYNEFVFYDEFSNSGCSMGLLLHLAQLRAINRRACQEIQKDAEISQWLSEQTTYLKNLQSTQLNPDWDTTKKYWQVSNAVTTNYYNFLYWSANNSFQYAVFCQWEILSKNSTLTDGEIIKTFLINNSTLKDVKPNLGNALQEVAKWHSEFKDSEGMQQQIISVSQDVNLFYSNNNEWIFKTANFEILNENLESNKEIIESNYLFMHCQEEAPSLSTSINFLIMLPEKIFPMSVHKNVMKQFVADNFLKKYTRCKQYFKTTDKKIVMIHTNKKDIEEYKTKIDDLLIKTLIKLRVTELWNYLEKYKRDKRLNWLPTLETSLTSKDKLLQPIQKMVSLFVSPHSVLEEIAKNGHDKQDKKNKLSKRQILEKIKSKTSVIQIIQEAILLEEYKGAANLLGIKNNKNIKR